MRDPIPTLGQHRRAGRECVGIRDGIALQAVPAQLPGVDALMRPLQVALGWIVALGWALAAATVPMPVRAQEPWQADLDRFVATDRQQPPPDNAVLFVGSSSIRLWPELARDFPQVPTINRGFGGSRLADAARLADRIVAPYRPRQVVIYAGDNDLADGLTPAQVAADYALLVRRLRELLPGTPIAYIAIKPSPARVHLIDAAREANQRIRALAAGGQAVDFIDVFTPMLDAAGQPRADLFGADGLHLNAAGYALWVERIAPFLRLDAKDRPRTVPASEAAAR